MSSEFERIATLCAVFAAQSRRGIVVGIGDDAAVLESPPGRVLVWTIDEQVEGTHFRRDFASWGDVGWRSFMAAASDLAAMGAEPYAALAAITLPKDLDDAALEALAEGQRAAAAQVGSPIVGGNLARGDAVSVATTLLGVCPRAVVRGGGRVGDGLWVAGEVGLAAAGLAALLRGDAQVDVLTAAAAAWRRPVARIAEGLAMAAHGHAAIDVSDGLAQDVAHLARASGVCAVLDEAALRACSPATLAAAAALGADALELILHGGEDYALVIACDHGVAGFQRIGELRAGKGVVLARDGGGEEAITPRGFDHFSP